MKRIGKFLTHPAFMLFLVSFAVIQSVRLSLALNAAGMGFMLHGVLDDFVEWWHKRGEAPPTE